jgi:hypothetical protein
MEGNHPAIAAGIQRIQIAAENSTSFITARLVLHRYLIFSGMAFMHSDNILGV